MPENTELLDIKVGGNIDSVGKRLLYFIRVCWFLAVILQLQVVIKVDPEVRVIAGVGLMGLIKLSVKITVNGPM